MENEGQVEGVGIIRSVWRLLVLLFSLSAHSEKMFLIIVLAFFRTLFLSHFRNIGASTIRYIYIDIVNAFHTLVCCFCFCHIS